MAFQVPFPLGCWEFYHHIENDHIHLGQPHYWPTKDQHFLSNMSLETDQHLTLESVSSNTHALLNTK